MRTATREWCAALLLVALAAAAGCSTAVHSAASAAGAEVGEAAGEAIVRDYAPEFRRWYLNYLTRLAFFSGGYSVAPAAHDYEEGEYTRFRVNTSEGERIAGIERALLFEDREGNEAWQVRFVDHQANDTTVVEMLFAPEREQLLRMRAKFPDDSVGSEVPVEEDQYYRRPDRLTEESVEGATVGIEDVRVPAGTFEARHVRYRVAGVRGEQSWWLVDDVPGGLVRYAHSARDGDEDDDPESAKGLDDDDYVLELVDHGDGAESSLGMEP